MALTDFTPEQITDALKRLQDQQVNWADDVPWMKYTNMAQRPDKRWTQQKLENDPQTRPMTDAERRVLKHALKAARDRREAIRQALEDASSDRVFECGKCGHQEKGPPDFAVMRKFKHSLEEADRNWVALSWLEDRNLVPAEYPPSAALATPDMWVGMMKTWARAHHPSRIESSAISPNIYSCDPHKFPSGNEAYEQVGARVYKVDGVFCPKCLEAFLKMAVPQMEPKNG